MFVTDNALSSAKQYMQEELKESFSLSEIKHIAREVFAVILPEQAHFMLASNVRLSESELLFIRSVVKRLKNDEPLPYVLGNIHFYGLDFICDDRALIPRPETAELVDWIVKDYQQERYARSVDVCTGSGCIAISLVKHLQNATCVGVDVSERALELAAENSQKLSANATWLQSDVLQKDWEPKEWVINGFDFWVSNPPYIEVNEKSQLSKTVLNYEPHLALFAPADDPLRFYSHIAQSAMVFLRSGGHIYFELNEFNALNAALLMEAIGFVNIEMRKDLQGKTRMIRAQKR